MRTYRKRRGVKSRKTKKQRGVRRGRKRTQIRGGNNYDERRRALEYNERRRALEVELELQVTNMELTGEIKSEINNQFQNYFELCSEYRKLKSNKIKTELLDMETIIEKYLNTTDDINDTNKEILLGILDNYPCFEKN